MINSFKENEVRESGVVYNGTWEQIKMLYSQDPAKAGELAISAIELTLTGEISSDDFMVKLALGDLTKIVEKDRNKWSKTKENRKQKKMEEYRLEEIAELHNQGFTQKEIGEKLGIPQQTVGYRLNNIIKADYPELIVYQKNQDYQKNQSNVNDNVNVNVNVNEGFSAHAEQSLSDGAAAPTSVASPQEQDKKELFRF